MPLQRHRQCAPQTLGGKVIQDNSLSHFHFDLACCVGRWVKTKIQNQFFRSVCCASGLRVTSESGGFSLSLTFDFSKVWDISKKSGPESPDTIFLGWQTYNNAAFRLQRWPQGVFGLSVPCIRRSVKTGSLEESNGSPLEDLNQVQRCFGISSRLTPRSSHGTETGVEFRVRKSPSPLSGIH
jgi:hypothetical protein